MSLLSVWWVSAERRLNSASTCESMVKVVRMMVSMA